MKSNLSKKFEAPYQMNLVHLCTCDNLFMSFVILICDLQFVISNFSFTINLSMAPLSNHTKVAKIHKI